MRDAETEPAGGMEAEARGRRRVSIALAVAAVLGMGCSSGGRSPSEPVIPTTPGSETLGYAGPSVVTRIALGVTESFPAFSAWDGRTLLNLNGGGMDGCDVWRWARMDGSRGEYCWSHYEQMLDANPGTDRVLFMVGFKPGREIGVEETRQVTQALQDACASRLAGGCTIFISGLPDYVDTCGDMPTNGIPALSRSVAAAIAGGTPGVLAGPEFSAVTSADVSDQCHQNQRKRAEHAAELMTHLGETD